MVFMKKQVITKLLLIVGILIFGSHMGVLAASERANPEEASQSDTTQGTKLDLAILFDDTGSMDHAIIDLKAKVNDLTNSITSSKIDCRYSLISFKDIVTIRQNWTSDPGVIKRAVDALEASGGDDTPEADLDAIETALSLGFRPDAYHMILDITDERTHYRGDGTAFSEYTISDIVSNLTSKKVSYILVGPAALTDPFNSLNDKKEIVYALGENGLFIDINSDDLSHILDTIMGIITKTYTTGNAILNQKESGNVSPVPVTGGADSEGVINGTGESSSAGSDEAVFSSYDTSGMADKDLTAPVTSGSETLTGDPTAGSINPVLSGVITPDTAEQGGSVRVTMTGENFMPDAVIRLIKGDSSIELKDPQISRSSITGTFIIPSDALTGTYNLQIENPGGMAVTGKNLFTISGSETSPNGTGTRFSPDLGKSDTSGADNCEGWEVTSGYHLDGRAMDTTPPPERISSPWCWCNGYPYNKNYQTCVRTNS